MGRHHSRAIVLSSTDYGDYDRIVTLFTRDFGKMTGIAKGAKKSMKRFGGALELGMMGDLSFFEKKGASLVRLEHCDILRSWKSIRADLEKYLVVCQMLELVRELLPDREKNSEVFSLFLHMMTILEEIRSADSQSFLLSFEMKLLRLTGFRPNLEQCVICRATLSGLQSRKAEDFPLRAQAALGAQPYAGLMLGFNPDKGGCVCHECRTYEADITDETLAGMRRALNVNLKDLVSFFLSPQRIEEGLNLLRQFIEIRVGKKLKAHDVAQSITRTREIFSS